MVRYWKCHPYESLLQPDWSGRVEAGPLQGEVVHDVGEHLEAGQGQCQCSGCVAGWTLLSERSCKACETTQLSEDLAVQSDERIQGTYVNQSGRGT